MNSNGEQFFSVNDSIQMSIPQENELNFIKYSHQHQHRHHNHHHHSNPYSFSPNHIVPTSYNNSVYPCDANPIPISMRRSPMQEIKVDLTHDQTSSSHPCPLCVNNSIDNRILKDRESVMDGHTSLMTLPDDGPYVGHPIGACKSPGRTFNQTTMMPTMTDNDDNPHDYNNKPHRSFAQRIVNNFYNYLPFVIVSTISILAVILLVSATVIYFQCK